jgi:putative transposase
VTVLTRQRRRHFVRPEVVALAASEVQRAAAHTRFEIVAACYMPDHLHLVVQGLTTGANFLTFIAKAKQFSAYYVKRRFGIVLWARGYHDRIVREDECVARYVAYVRNNPVKAKLVKNPEDYPFLTLSPGWREYFERAG